MEALHTLVRQANRNVDSLLYFYILIFMAPMVVLYLVSIGVSAAVVRRRKKRMAAEQATPA